MLQPIRLWREAARRHGPELAAALVGLGWFLVIGGWRALPFTSLDWLHGDPWQHLMGWLFFRRSAWQLPLGRVDGFPWPLGTTIGFTDANPLLAIPFKLIEGVLPQEFQYIGLWLAVCFALQGWYGARLAAVASSSPSWRVLGGSFFALSPVLLARIGHDTLCAHWAVLALLVLNLERRQDVEAERRAVWRGIAIALLVALVHPYLAIMVLGLALALVVRAGLDGVFPWRSVALRAAALVFGQAALLGLQGYFTTARSHGGGFGLFATDLLALVNPAGASTFFPDVPVRLEQAEGYAYLGAGGLTLLVVVIVSGLAPRRADAPAAPGRPVTLTPLLIVVALMAAFAITPVVHVAGQVVLDARAPFRRLVWATGPLRSSGRFIWPAYYLLLAAAMMLLVRRLPRPGLATLVLGASLALQVVDLAPRAAGAHFHVAPWRLGSATWELARGHYDLVALYPPQINVEDSIACRGLVYGDDDHWAPLAHLAYAQGMAVNSGQLARGAIRLLDAACEGVSREIEAGRFRRRTVYVVHPPKLPLFVGAGAICGRVEGYHVCVSSEQRDAFRSALERR
jgi:hypothetical protein